MYRFLSQEWIRAYADEWNRNEKLKSDLSKTYETWEELQLSLDSLTA